MNELTRKAYTGLGQFIIALFLIIFLPVWSLNFWQAWIYTIIFSISVFIITAYFLKYDPKLIERRLTAGPAAEKEKSQKIIQIVTSIGFILLIIFPSIDQRFMWSHVNTSFVIVADLFVIVGFFIIFLVFKENSYTSGIIETDKNQKVISTGPYAVVRHPMYAGALILFTATPIALGSYWGLFFSIFLIIMLGVRLLDEEKFLKKNLKGYTEYCHRIPYHLIPYVW